MHLCFDNTYFFTTPRSDLFLPERKRRKLTEPLQCRQPAVTTPTAAIATVANCRKIKINSNNKNSRLKNSLRLIFCLGGEKNTKIYMPAKYGKNQSKFLWVDLFVLFVLATQFGAIDFDIWKTPKKYLIKMLM